MSLETTTRTLGDVIIVECAGRIVLGEETANLRNLVANLMNETPSLVLDLSEVAHIDSNGIGMLFGLHIAAQKRGVTIKLAGLGGRIKEVAEITRLSTVFEVFPTADAAAASLSPAVAAAVEE